MQFSENPEVLFSVYDLKQMDRIQGTFCCRNHIILLRELTLLKVQQIKFWFMPNN